jgi:hypothetical protein
LEPNSWLKLVIGLMTPPKEGFFTNIGKNFAETLQFEDLAVKNFFLFYNVHIFVKKILNWYKMNFYECLKKTKNILRKKSHSVFEGLKGAPSNTLKLFSTKCF